MADSKNSSANLDKMLTAVKEKWYIAVLTIVFCVLAAAYYSLYLSDVEYVASTKIYVSNDKVNQNEVEYTNLLTADKIAGVCKEIAKSDKVINAAEQQLGGNFKINKSKISVSSPVTSMIQLTVRDGDNVRAADIANAVTDELIINAKDITKISNITPIDKATVPVSPASNNFNIYCILAAVAGLVIGVGLILVLELFNKTIKGPEDITEKYGLPILGLIPKSDNSDKKESNGRNTKNVT